MRRIPTLLEVERRHILNTLQVCGNNRTATAKALGLSVRGLRTKLHRYQQAGFAIPAPLAGNEVRGDINGRGPTKDGQLKQMREPSEVIEELISVVEAISERVQPDEC